MTTRLAIRINKLTAKQRLTLCRKLGIGNTTLYRRLADPGKFTMDEITRMKRYMDELDGEDYDMRKLCQPIVLAAARHQRIKESA